MKVTLGYEGKGYRSTKLPKLARRTDRRGAWSLAPLVGVQAEAAKVREAGLPRTAAGLQKVVVVTLKAVLAARGLATCPCRHAGATSCVDAVSRRAEATPAICGVAVGGPTTALAVSDHMQAPTTPSGRGVTREPSCTSLGALGVQLHKQEQIRVEEVLARPQRRPARRRARRRCGSAGMRWAGSTGGSQSSSRSS